MVSGWRDCVDQWLRAPHACGMVGGGLCWRLAVFVVLVPGVCRRIVDWCIVSPSVLGIPPWLHSPMVCVSAAARSPVVAGVVAAPVSQSCVAALAVACSSGGGVVAVGPPAAAAFGAGVVLLRLLVAAAVGTVRAVPAAVALPPRRAAVALREFAAPRAGVVLLRRLAGRAAAVVAPAVVFPGLLLPWRRRGAVAVCGCPHQRGRVALVVGERHFLVAGGVVAELGVQPGRGIWACAGLHSGWLLLVGLALPRRRSRCLLLLGAGVWRAARAVLVAGGPLAVQAGVLPAAAAVAAAEGSPSSRLAAGLLSSLCRTPSG